MIEIFRLQGYICELNFGYNTKMEGYANSRSDIPKLDETWVANVRKTDKFYNA